MLLNSPWWTLLDTCSAQLSMYVSNKHSAERCAVNIYC